MCSSTIYVCSLRKLFKRTSRCKPLQFSTYCSRKIFSQVTGGSVSYSKPKTLTIIIITKLKIKHKRNQCSVVGTSTTYYNSSLIEFGTVLQTVETVLQIFFSYRQNLSCFKTQIFKKKEKYFQLFILHYHYKNVFIGDSKAKRRKKNEKKIISIFSVRSPKRHEIVAAAGIDLDYR